MNNNNENASVGVTFKFGNKQGVSAEFGVIESNPNAPYNPNNNLNSMILKIHTIVFLV